VTFDASGPASFEQGGIKCLGAFSIYVNNPFGFKPIPSYEVKHQSKGDQSISI